MPDTRYQMDDADRTLISALRQGGRTTNAEVARATGMARGTVQTRLARLEERGVITGWGPELDPRATEHDVMAFTTLAIAQGAHDGVLAILADMPEVLEVHVVTGSGDLLCRIAARSNDHLHELIQRVVHADGVIRSESQLALATPVRRTVADLIAGTRR